MKRLFVVSFFLSCTVFSMAQVDLTVMPKAQRDSALVNIVQNYLLRKFPQWYREDVQPVVMQGKFMSVLKWGLDFEKNPDYVKPEDVWYRVILYYEKWSEEKEFSWDFTAEARVVGKTGEVCHLLFGNGFGHDWGYLHNLPDVSSDKKRLSALPEAERDSILTEIACRTIKEKWPELYRENLEVDVQQGDCSILRIKWKKHSIEKSALPDYANPSDIYYRVTLYYKDWEKEKIFAGADIASVYIIEKTREPYLIQSGAFGPMWRTLLHHKE